jgi:hypothetical protein
MFSIEPAEKGVIANIKTRTPMPPIQCVKLRQNNMPLGSDSTSFKMLAPVVVKPETVSNTLSTKDGITLLSIKGSAPNIDISIHDKAATHKPPMVYITLFVGCLSVHGMPMAKRRVIVIKKAKKERLSPLNNETKAAGTMQTASILRTNPKI